MSHFTDGRGIRRPDLYFTVTAWPDFTLADFITALQWFDRRDRRFGILPAAGAGV